MQNRKQDVRVAPRRVLAAAGDLAGRDQADPGEPAWKKKRRG